MKRENMGSEIINLKNSYNNSTYSHANPTNKWRVCKIFFIRLIHKEHMTCKDIQISFGSAWLDRENFVALLASCDILLLCGTMNFIILKLLYDMKLSNLVVHICSFSENKRNKLLIPIFVVPTVEVKGIPHISHVNKWKTGLFLLHNYVFITSIMLISRLQNKKIQNSPIPYSSS